MIENDNFDYLLTFDIYDGKGVRVAKLDVLF